MISKDEIVKSVAQSCGVSIEISAFFFEVFINRLSNKLRPGDLLHFHSLGYFHKRNCRIQIEKTSDSPTPKSYLIQLVLFASETKIRSDLSEVQFLKIPNLKTLWVDDKDFQKSLNAGDFSPYTDRNQLIKSFATKAEVIISSLRKDYDSDLVEELIIPLTFDLNFLVQSGKTSKSKIKSETKSVKVEYSDNAKIEKADIEPEKEKNTKETRDELPWNYGTKFLEKDKSGTVKLHNEIESKPEIPESSTIKKNENDQVNRNPQVLKDFEVVQSHRTVTKNDSEVVESFTTSKFSVVPSSTEISEQSSRANKFTEVKSKTEPYRQGGDFGKSKKKFDKYSNRRYSDEKAFTARRNFLPIVASVSFIIIVAIVVYIYFIRSDDNIEEKKSMIAEISPPNNVKIIDRDYDLVVSYPYPKIGDRIEMSGYGDEIFSKTEFKSVIENETKPKIKNESKTEKVTELNENPKQAVKIEPPTEIKSEPVIEPKNETVSRIFLYRNFYVVNVGNYGSEEAANREADKYYDLGYNAIIEVIETRDGARIYKLNVGDFTSEDFARQFQEKYIK